MLTNTTKQAREKMKRSNAESCEAHVGLWVPAEVQRRARHHPTFGQRDASTAAANAAAADGLRAWREPGRPAPGRLRAATALHAFPIISSRTLPTSAARVWGTAVLRGPTCLRASPFILRWALARIRSAPRTPTAIPPRASRAPAWSHAPTTVRPWAASGVLLICSE
jgi:hypothetical protein